MSVLEYYSMRTANKRVGECLHLNLLRITEQQGRDCYSLGSMFLMPVERLHDLRNLV